MRDPSNSPEFNIEQGKDSHFLAQLERVYAAFAEESSTILELSVLTGIFEANIYRYVAKWESEKKNCLDRVGVSPFSKLLPGFDFSSIQV